MNQKLFEENYDRRVQTVKQLLLLLQKTGLEDLIYFSDEATFCVRIIQCALGL